MIKPIFAAVVVTFAAAAAAQDDGLVTTPRGETEEAAAVVDDTTVPMQQDDGLKPFVGTLRCSGTSSTEMGAEVPTTFTLRGKKDVGGRWLVVTTELTPKAKGAKPIVSQELWGYSRAQSTLVRSGATSLGGWLQSTSTGWAADRFSWTGETTQHAKPAKEKLSFTKKSDKELEVQVAIGTPELRVIFEGVCKK
jgi:hypothetical protein